MFLLYHAISVNIWALSDSFHSYTQSSRDMPWLFAGDMAASRDKETPGVLKPHEATVHQCESKSSRCQRAWNRVREILLGLSWLQSRASPKYLVQVPWFLDFLPTYEFITSAGLQIENNVLRFCFSFLLLLLTLRIPHRFGSLKKFESTLVVHCVLTIEASPCIWSKFAMAWLDRYSASNLILGPTDSFRGQPEMSSLFEKPRKGPKFVGQECFSINQSFLGWKNEQQHFESFWYICLTMIVIIFYFPKSNV